MRESIGFTFTLNIIIIFIFIAFAILMGIMSYSKAYRVNSKITNAIEICEGYNDCAENEINRVLANVGYGEIGRECRRRDNIDPIARRGNFDYCVYQIENNEPRSDEEHEYYHYDRYEIVTYMVIDFPIVDRIRIPLKNRTDMIYRFPNDRRGE